VRRAALTLLAAVVLAGCGGSNGLSDKDYRTKANAICARIKFQRERLPTAQTFEELRSVVQSTIAINTDALRKFKELDPPSDLKGPHTIIVTRLAETLRLQQQAVKLKPNSSGIRPINVRAGEARNAMLQAAKDAKLTACEQL
jgi:hypothetical protein